LASEESGELIIFDATTDAKLVDDKF